MECARGIFTVCDFHSTGDNNLCLANQKCKFQINKSKAMQEVLK